MPLPSKKDLFLAALDQPGGLDGRVVTLIMTGVPGVVVGDFIQDDSYADVKGLLRLDFSLRFGEQLDTVNQVLAKMARNPGPVERNVEVKQAGDVYTITWDATDEERAALKEHYQQRFPDCAIEVSPRAEVLITPPPAANNIKLHVLVPEDE